MSFSSGKDLSSPTERLQQLQSWKLEDADGQLSEIVRQAQSQEPQRIVVRGEDAAVILSTQTFMKLLPLLEGPKLSELLSRSPLHDLEFESDSVRSPIREIDL